MTETVNLPPGSEINLTAKLKSLDTTKKFPEHQLNPHSIKFDTPDGVATVEIDAQYVAAPVTPPPPPPPPGPVTPPVITAPDGIPGTWKLVEDVDFTKISTLAGCIFQTGWFPSYSGSAPGEYSGPANGSEVAGYDSANVYFAVGGLVLDLTQKTVHTAKGSYSLAGSCISTNPHDGRPSSVPSFQVTPECVTQFDVTIPGVGGKIPSWVQLWRDGQTWPSDGEQDDLEGLGGAAEFHWHGPNTSGGYGGSGALALNTPTTVASHWKAGEVDVYYGGKLVGTETKDIVSDPQYVVAINGAGLGAQSPCKMLISRFRAWTPGS